MEGKGKGHPTTGHEFPEGEQSYSSNISLISTLDVDVWSTPRPGCFIPSKETRFQYHKRLGGAPGTVWTCAGNLALHRDSIPGPSST